ncbi:MAG: hypothetical protein ACR2JO_09555 [Mycobacteriales bacterium]
MDWRRRAATMADVDNTIRDVLDPDLPAETYPPAVLSAYDLTCRSAYDLTCR